MQLSDWINLGVCLASFILAAISVVTVVITIRQNKKMIENSTRPYIVLTGKKADFGTPYFYLVLKNYGASSAKIIDFHFESLELENYNYGTKLVPFYYITGTTLAPGQAITCNLDGKKLTNDGVNEINATITYTNGMATYTEKFSINYKALTKIISLHDSTQGKELRTIAHILQQMAEDKF